MAARLEMHKINMLETPAVYKFTLNCIVYSKLLSQVTSLHYVNIVYSKFATDQSVSYYTLHGFVAFVSFVQSESFPPMQLHK